MGELLLPKKKIPLPQADKSDLEYWVKRVGDDLDAGRSKYPDHDKRLHAAMIAELVSREGATNGNSVPAQSTQAGTQLATVETDEKEKLTGSYREPNAVSGRLQRAAKKYHLISPAPNCPQLPEGFSVAISAVLVDVAHETYPMKEDSNKRALSKAPLDKISGCAGISWDAQQSGRIDDGSDPHYCEWRAVGTMRHFDNTEVQLVGHKTMDLRSGSDQIAGMSARRLEGLRAFITEHAETKARLRAIRSLGIRSSYSAEELKKPFIVAKLMFTGDSDDPELKRLFAEKNADAALGGVKALFGAQPVPPPARAELPKHAPPPIEQSRADDDYPEAPGKPVAPANDTDPRQEELDY